MRKRNYTALAFALMLSACLIGCGSETKSKNNTNNPPIEDTLTTASNANLFVDTYWLNEDAGIGYHFEEDILHTIAHGNTTKSSYTVVNNVINAGKETIEYVYYGETVDFTIGAISLEFTKVSKEDFYKFSGTPVPEDPTTDSGSSSTEETTTPSGSSSTTTVLVDTYWSTGEGMMLYRFTSDKMYVVFFGKEMGTPCTVTETQIISGDEKATYKLDGNTLTITSDGEAVVFTKITKADYDKLVVEKAPEEGSGNLTTDSEYVGMTINQFVKSGAEISGYSKLSGTYEFTGYNEDKGEKYTFTLDKDPKSALDSREPGDDYEDFIGDFKIATIKVIKIDNAAIQKYVGKTIKDFEKDGYDIKGYMQFGKTLILYALPKDDNPRIQITLGEDALTKFEKIKKPGDADMGVEFADFAIKAIEYNLSF